MYSVSVDNKKSSFIVPIVEPGHVEGHTAHWDDVNKVIHQTLYII